MSSQPTRVPTAGIEHATGPTDVVLRFDSGPDYAFGELTGTLFMPGPEFTLYGDGTVIFRNDQQEPPAAEGPIFRARPFLIARLDEDQVQALLRFALLEGGLRTARQRYETKGVDDFGYSLFVVRAGGLDKRVQVVGHLSPGNEGPDGLARDAFAALADHLRNFDREGSFPTQVWVPDRYWGVLTEAGIWLEAGLLPDVPDTGAAAWPWQGVAPREFVFRNDRFYILEELPANPNPPGDRRRMMSAEEAAVLGLSDKGGVVQGIYVVGPDDGTIYWLSLWPLLPDETG